MSRFADATCGSFISIELMTIVVILGGPAQFVDAFIRIVYATFNIDALGITLSQAKVRDEEHIVGF